MKLREWLEFYFTDKSQLINKRLHSSMTTQATGNWVTDESCQWKILKSKNFFFWMQNYINKMNHDMLSEWSCGPPPPRTECSHDQGQDNQIDTEQLMRFSGYRELISEVTIYKTMLTRKKAQWLVYQQTSTFPGTILRSSPRGIDFS